MLVDNGKLKPLANVPPMNRFYGRICSTHMSRKILGSQKMPSRKVEKAKETEGASSRASGEMISRMVKNNGCLCFVAGWCVRSLSSAILYVPL